MDCTPKYTPLPLKIVFSWTQAPATEKEYVYMKNKPYSEVLGSLMYAQVGTHPDIAYAITSLSCFMLNPENPHWLALMHVIRYIKGTLSYKIRYKEISYGNYVP